VNNLDLIYGPEERACIAELFDVAEPQLTAENWSQHPEICREAEAIFSGWGMATMNEAFLAAFPKLKIVFYGSGSIKCFATDAMWERGIQVVSAFRANGIPVVEFTVAEIVLSAKHAWRFAAVFRRAGGHPLRYDPPGMFGSTVGIISLGTIGRSVAERLKDFEVTVLAYDPFIKPADAAALGVKLVSLEEIFTQSDVVSCHAPNLKETKGMLHYKHFSSMKPDSTFINTARGAVVNEPDLITVLTERPDIWAILDVTSPEPPCPGSPFYTLPNVMLTPHIAGSMGLECRRMGIYMVEEARRYLAGEPLQHGITQAQAKIMA